MEQLFFSTDTNQAKQLSQRYRTKHVRRIFRGIYTDDLTSPLSIIVKKHWMQIVHYLVPHRDNYLNGLRRMSRDHIFQTYCKVMDQAQAYTESIDWMDYNDARAKIEKDQANLLPDDGLQTFNQILRTLPLSDFTI